MKKKLLCAGVALATLAGGLIVACSSGTSGRCVPKRTAQVSSAELEGTYRGSHDADGARITLKTSPGEFGGTMTVRRWPTDDFPRYGGDKTFDGSGRWQVSRTAGSGKYPMLKLSFETPEDPLATAGTVALLSIGVDAKHSVLYDDADPDTCPAFRLERE
ncbi:hypothetical protein GTW43_09945 [Streptomyces sp. SID5785]|uniref:hypothetical protein n=1 Tax=Streptomyces sp. SID5785 TaxID=2690309 RepID=UPI0013619C44|nr:hypothetical protein [Streptomyces sp. SID5785]MZD05400.1 hypothetical protein [Streptomyces sp. SID5785]